MHDQPTVRPANASEISDLAVAAGHAFADDPAWNWILPNKTTQLTRLTRFFNVLFESDFRDGSRDIAMVDGGRAVASWARPHGRHRSLRTSIVGSGRIVRALGLGGAIRLGLIELYIDKRLRREPGWYLEILATHPDRQGQGDGSALLRAQIAEIGATEEITLATQTERNVTYYARFGFQEIDTYVLPFRGPRMWILKRPIG